MDNWDNINAVQRAQDYIDQHINEPITLYMLAKAAGYSPWYTSRIFKQLTGKPPLEYIRTLRLSRAAVKLWDQDKRIIDIALDFAFDSHEGFTRAFSDNFGITPNYYCYKMCRNVSTQLWVETFFHVINEIDKFHQNPCILSTNFEGYYQISSKANDNILNIAFAMRFSREGK